MPSAGTGRLSQTIKQLLLALAFLAVLLAGGIALIHQQTGGLPDVEVSNLEQQPVSLDAIADGKPLVVNLWATWCPPCIREMPVLQQAQQRYPDIRFVFANQGEHPETIRSFLQEQDLALRNVLSDQKGSFGLVSGSHGLPSTLFYNAEGKLVDSHVGELSQVALERKLERFDAAYRNQTASATGQ